MAGYNKSYYMALLENRAKRLHELLEVAAPEDMIYKEIMLLADAAQPFAPAGTPKSFGYGNTPWGHGNGTWGQNNEEYQSNIQSRCATG